MTRRQALKTGAVGLGTIGTLGLSQSGVDIGPLDVQGPVGEADALGPLGGLLVVGGVAVAGSFAAGWATREAEIIGSDDVPDGLGPETLQDQVWQKAKIRESYIDNSIGQARNTLQYMQDNAFAEGKRAALDLLNDPDSSPTKSEVINEAQMAADEHFATVEENLINAWNASVDQFEIMRGSVVSHPDLSPGSIFSASGNWTLQSDDPETQNVVLRDDREVKIKAPVVKHSTGDWEVVTPIRGVDSGTVSGISYLDYAVDSSRFEQKRGGQAHPIISVSHPEFPASTLLQTVGDGAEWWYEGGVAEAFFRVQQAAGNVAENLSLWVDNTYSEIQSGEISPAEYVTGSDLAENIAAENPRARAVSDLVAMNLPIDLDGEMTIKLLNDEITMQGFLAVTDNTNLSKLEPGDTLDPQATDQDGNPLYGTVYFAFRPGTYIQPWSEWAESYGIQGGEIRFTADPTQTSEGYAIENAEYVIETAQGETARVGPGAFSEESIDGTTYWTADLSADLDQTITDVNRIRRVFAGGEDQSNTYTTTILEQPIEVVEIEGKDSVELQKPRKAQTVDNYTTDEEWQQIIDRQKELIERFEDATAGGGAGGDSILDDLPRLGLLPGWVPGGKFVEYAIVGGGGLLGINILTS